MTRIDDSFQHDDTTQQPGSQVAEGDSHGNRGFRIESVAAPVSEGDSGENNVVTLTVTRDTANDAPATVSFRALLDGNSPAQLIFADGQDALQDNGGRPSGELSFAAGETRKTISIRLKGDDIVEPDQQFDVVLSDPSKGTQILVDKVTVSVVDDDKELADHSFDTIFSDAVNQYEHGVATGVSHFTALDRATDAARQIAADSGMGAEETQALAEAVRDTLITRFELGDVIPESGTALMTGPFARQDPFTADDTGYVYRDPEMVKPDFIHYQGFLEKEYTPEHPSVPQIPSSPEPPPRIIPPEVVPSPSTPVVEIFQSQEIIEGQDGPVTVVYFRVVRSDGSGASSVDWSITGGSLSPEDFVDGVIPSGTVMFADGEKEKIISVKVVDDLFIEGDEDITITLSNPGENLEIGPHDAVNLIVHDNEVGYQIFADQPSVIEDAEGRQVVATFTITRSTVSDQERTISYKAVPISRDSVSLEDFSDGQDGLGNNRGFPSGSVTFAPGETEKKVSIYLDGDDYVAANEDFAVTIFDQPPGELIYTGIASTTVIDDDAVVNISTSTPILPEGHTTPSTFVFTVTRTGSLLSAADIDYSVGTFGETSIQPDDLVGGILPSGTIHFAPGQAEATITIEAVPDSIVESNENFYVQLSNPGGNLKIGEHRPG